MSFGLFAWHASHLLQSVYFIRGQVVIFFVCLFLKVTWRHSDMDDTIFLFWWMKRWRALRVVRPAARWHWHLSPLRWRWPLPSTHHRRHCAAISLEEIEHYGSRQIINDLFFLSMSFFWWLCILSAPSLFNIGTVSVLWCLCCSLSAFLMQPQPLILCFISVLAHQLVLNRTESSAETEAVMLHLLPPLIFYGRLLTHLMFTDVQPYTTCIYNVSVVNMVSLQLIKQSQYTRNLRDLCTCSQTFSPMAFIIFTAVNWAIVATYTNPIYFIYFIAIPMI